VSACLDADELVGRHRPIESGAEQGGDQRHPRLQHILRVEVAAVHRVERVEAHSAARTKCDRYRPGGRAQRRILALGVEQHRLATEEELTVHERLDECRFATTDLADHQHVRAGEIAALV
jgi:hypothetical protein